MEGGGLLFKALPLNQEQAPQEQAAARGIVAAYNLMRPDAVGIAAQDLAAGLPFLRELAATASFPWLSADLVARDGGRPFFTPFVTKKVGTVTVAIVALTGPAAAATLQPDDNAVVRPWQELMPGLLAQLGNADCLLLLSGLPPAENEALARRHPGIHLIVQAGDDGAANQPPRLVNNTLVLQTEKQGKHLGLLDIRWAPSKRWGEDHEKKLAGKKNELDRVQWFIRSHQRKGDPEVLYRNDLGRLKSYQELVAQERQLQEEIKRLNEAAARKAGQAEALVDHRFLALTTDLPEEAAVQAVVEQTTKTVNRLGQELARAQLERHQAERDAMRPHVGWQRCAECHRTEADFWRQSRHAGAYETLRAKNQHFNQACLACHVTGPASPSLPAALQAVGCETCHGPGLDHSRDPQQPMVRRPAEALCLRCHTPDQDDNFNYANDLRRLNCPHVKP